ncbi:General negative regulator of transcription subunit 3 [Diplonema papillatum]|nr:General negative regulator of transcription subunit 3 [Diplonema papillatum]
MAQNKKLAAEIDRTLKKVVEGIQIFDDIWDKLHAAAAQNLKERLQADLKTEIKKLQRLRDQIKTWQGMSDVRDKRSIDEARRNIEAKMEQFKACEREAKIKTFSKIGLSQPTREDPEEVARDQARGWLNETIGTLNLQIEQAEADVEGGAVRKSKRKGKQSNDSEAQAGKEKLANLRHHVAKLEQLLRMLDNEQVTPDDVESIQELINSFVERNGEADYDPVEVEGVYDDIVPEDPDDTFPDTPTQPSLDKKMDKDAEQTPLPAAAAQPTPQQSPQSGPLPSAAAGSKKAGDPSTPSTPASAAGAKSKKKSKEDGGSDSKVGTPTSTAMSTPPSQALAQLQPSPAPNSKTAPQPALNPPPSPTSSKTASPQQNYASIVKAQPNKKTVTTPTQPALAERQGGNLPRSGSANSTSSAAASQSGKQPKEKGSAPSSPVTPTAAVKVAPRQQQQQQQQQQQSANGTNPPPSPSAAATSAPSSAPGTPTAYALRDSTSNAAAAAAAAQPKPAHASLLSEEARSNNLRMFQQSCNNLPTPEDTRKRQPYIPPNPYKTQSYYPQQPHPAFEQPDVFSKFKTDTLFFIFYYQQATYQQYMAAKELKKQSWRFHKKYLTWFQRAKPPDRVNEDYEQGTYMFFDFEDTWRETTKKEFSFQYCYLEDELPPVT